MKKIIFVTHNKGKVKSAEKYFKNIKLSTIDFELDEPRSDDIQELLILSTNIVRENCENMFDKLIYRSYRVKSYTNYNTYKPFEYILAWGEQSLIKEANSTE